MDDDTQAMLQKLAAEDGSRSDRQVSEHLLNLCERIYGLDTRQPDFRELTREQAIERLREFYGDSASEHVGEVRPPSFPPTGMSASIFPAAQWNSSSYFGNVLRKASLYAEFVVVAMPVNLEIFSGAMYRSARKSTSLEGALRIAQINQHYSKLVSGGHCVFLPQSISYSHGLAGFEVGVHQASSVAPLAQTEDESRFLPLTGSGYLPEHRELFSINT